MKGDTINRRVSTGTEIARLTNRGRAALNEGEAMCRPV